MKPSKGVLAAFTLGLLLVVLTIGLASAQEGDPPSRALSPDAPQAKSDFIPIQGRLTESGGLPLNGTYTLTFRLYDVYSGGTPLCQDDASYVDVNQGLFSTYMNAYGCEIDGRLLYLGVQVEGDGEMTPRQYIDNVPYAWSLRPGAVISSSMGNNAILHIENWAADNGRGLRAYAKSPTGTNWGIVGAAASPDGFGGYFYNSGGGVALDAYSQNGTGITARSVNGTGLNASSDNGIALLAEGTNDAAVWATSLYAEGVHGASGEGAGVAGYSLTGPGVYGESLNGVAIAANGAIASTEPTYLWISGNDTRKYFNGDTIYFDLNSRGGAKLFRGAKTEPQSIVLPITIAGTLYGQDVKLTHLELYWKGSANTDSIHTIRLRRQTGVCDDCYAELVGDTTHRLCSPTLHPEGCVEGIELTANNILDSQSGILYLTLELHFASGTSWIEFDGARLTLEYND